MRNVFSRILAVVLVLSLCATAVLAVGPGRERYFVDTDRDGICDNCGGYHPCDMTGTGRGRNFVDADGDGVCDRYATGQGSGNWQGHGRNYVDANGNGVCDHHGQGRGCHGFRGVRGR